MADHRERVRLGTLLLRDAAITLDQLEAALRSQVLYGGRLGTNLVELEILDVDTLGSYLSKMLGVPLADSALLDQTSPELLEWFGAERAQRYTAYPIYRNDGVPARVGVVLDDPTNSELLDALSTELDAIVEPYVVPELRLYYYLEKTYALPQRSRYVRPLQAVPGATSESTDRRRASEASVPKVVQLNPRSRRTTQVGAPPSPITEKSANVDTLIADLRTTKHRDNIGSILLEYAYGRLDAMAIFVVRGLDASGWCAFSRYRDLVDANIESLSARLDATSSMQSAFDAGDVFCGAPPSPGRPVENRLSEFLGIDHPPQEVAVIPITVVRRVVNLIYVHSLDGGPIAVGTLDELARLTREASAAYIRLIQASKA